MHVSVTNEEVNALYADAEQTRNEPGVYPEPGQYKQENKIKWLASGLDCEARRTGQSEGIGVSRPGHDDSRLSNSRS